MWISSKLEHHRALFDCLKIDAIWLSKFWIYPVVGDKSAIHRTLAIFSSGQKYWFLVRIMNMKLFSVRKIDLPVHFVCLYVCCFCCFLCNFCNKIPNIAVFWQYRVIIDSQSVFFNYNVLSFFRKNVKKKFYRKIRNLIPNNFHFGYLSISRTVRLLKR